ncbi:hypothetical protein OH76DRAFT_61225 [Lentinus brumalis]|uniref:Uncharacterized protein n=1 Tax=Lentinus brumalis TaxID=2498619 RepID=A0A371DKD4_9APHY|nr:hypothetical protein OH76DRAFT_61225 [Polyporus brumalis]
MIVSLNARAPALVLHSTYAYLHGLMSHVTEHSSHPSTNSSVSSRGRCRLKRTYPRAPFFRATYYHVHALQVPGRSSRPARSQYTRHPAHSHACRHVIGRHFACAFAAPRPPRLRPHCSPSLHDKMLCMCRSRDALCIQPPASRLRSCSTGPGSTLARANVIAALCISRCGSTPAISVQCEPRSGRGIFRAFYRLGQMCGRQSRVGQTCHCAVCTPTTSHLSMCVCVLSAGCWVLFLRQELNGLCHVGLVPRRFQSGATYVGSAFELQPSRATLGSQVQTPTRTRKRRSRVSTVCMHACGLNMNMTMNMNSNQDNIEHMINEMTDCTHGCHHASIALSGRGDARS